MYTYCIYCIRIYIPLIHRQYKYGQYRMIIQYIRDEYICKIIHNNSLKLSGYIELC